MKINKNAFTLVEILIGASMFVAVALISTVILAYTVYSRNKVSQQNQINQTAKDFFEEIGRHLRSSNSAQRIMICNINTNFKNSSDSDYKESYEVGGDAIGKRKIGSELRVYYPKDSEDNPFYPYNLFIYRYAEEKSGSGVYGIQRVKAKDQDQAAVQCDAADPSDPETINPQTIKLSILEQEKAGGILKNDTPYLAFVGCDDLMSDPPYACNAHGPIVRVIVGLESQQPSTGLGIRKSSSVFQTTFTTRRF